MALLAGIEAAAIEASGSANIVRGRLRVNIDPFFSRVVLATHPASFLGRYPEVSLELIMRDSVGDLVADGFDLALRFGEPPNGTFVARKLIDSRILTVASPAYLAAHGRPGHPAEVAGHACIDFYDAASGRPYDWEFRKGDEVLPGLANESGCRRGNADSAYALWIKGFLSCGSARPDRDSRYSVNPRLRVLART
jgi:DNA-binding transcriptional LysR family regulator